MNDTSAHPKKPLHYNFFKKYFKHDLGHFLNRMLRLLLFQILIDERDLRTFSHQYPCSPCLSGAFYSLSKERAI